MQTGYSGINTLYTGLFYNGGFCEWYYTPKEKIAVWPALGYNQELATEPVLSAGATWYGPVKVPDNTIGFLESQERNRAGIFYKQKVEGIQAGDGRENRIILENMPQYEYVVVGKLRAGGFYVMLGSPEAGLVFDHNFETGKGYVNATKSAFSFEGESICKALILPSFIGQPSTPSPGGSISGGSDGAGYTTNQTETIPFVSTESVVIEWTAARKSVYGNFPLIQVWFNDGLVYSLANVPITCDNQPPLTTTFTIDLTGVGSGFIQIK